MALSSFSPASHSSHRGSCPLSCPRFAATTTRHFASFHGPRPPLLSTSAVASLRVLSNPFSASLAVSRSKSRSGGRGTRFSIKACSQASAAGSNSLSEKFSELRDSCWRFLRPHTIRGTALGSIALVARALIESPELINWRLTFKAFYGLIALICGNGYIVGINQIYDIGIDKVNKPYLPIAAGDLSVESAWFLVLFFAAVGLLIVAWNFGPFISSLYCLGLFLGTIYSVPPFRLKRYPVVAFLIIATDFMVLPSLGETWKAMTGMFEDPWGLGAYPKRVLEVFQGIF